MPVGVRHDDLTARTSPVAGRPSLVVESFGRERRSTPQVM
ncbi:hypothetical protein IW249_003727 [Micromonospora vinacea]|uniref:FXSXX-COOH protein n=1 Tax=Micromonospora vinacea TaxID=709878 RepID=A0ABS0K590_9ACTN|nr:hypothetical protein [Micromonospora vinacea]